MTTPRRPVGVSPVKTASWLVAVMSQSSRWLRINQVEEYLRCSCQSLPHFIHDRLCCEFDRLVEIQGVVGVGVGRESPGKGKPFVVVRGAPRSADPHYSDCRCLFQWAHSVSGRLAA